MTVLNRVVLWARRWLRRPFARSRIIVAPPEPAAPIAPSGHNRRPIRTPANKALAKDAEESGRFFYFGDLLDRLDEHFYFLGRMKKDDPDGWKSYAAIGGSIVPERALLNVATFDTKTLPSTVPAFFCCTYSRLEDTPELTHIKLAYFAKMKRFAPIQRINGQVFSGTLYYSRRDNDDGYPAKIFIGVTPEGGVVPLRIDESWSQTVGKRRKAAIHHRDFRFPAAIVEIARQNKCTPDDVARTVFLASLSAFRSASSGVQVIAGRGRTNARFAIDLLRTPYFFRDRDRESGGKKIFHIVRGHERSMTDGRIATVRTHFRGERQFKWKGYDVSVSLDGLHHNSLLDFQAEAFDAEDPSLPAGTVESGKAMRMFAAHITRPMPNTMPPK